MALTKDRNTPMQDAELIAVPVASGAVCYAGGLATANATGYATPGATATTLTYLGRFDEQVDNSGGADGDLLVTVRRGKAFKWKNAGTDAVTQASLGTPCYIVDDETVAATDGSSTRSAAGVVVAIESDGVWVE
ncbi:hypothetical protein [Oceanobacter kriegii]|uniref:hypothetical protein n=1 Tax=Oceanobacter kriegii TaxID=64972 RepID=UPI0004192B6E|nr:hypothetical protein [Oceanobacter kriegii]